MWAHVALLLAGLFEIGSAQIMDIQPRVTIIPATMRRTLVRATTGGHIATINTPIDYTMQFTLITGGRTFPAWQNLIHVTASGNNCCAYGDRIPGLWWYANSRRFHLTDGSNGGAGNDECPYTTQLTANTAYSIRIELLATQTRLFINDTLACFENRAGRRPFNNAIVYASDPWHQAADAIITDWWWQPRTVPTDYTTHTFVGPNWVQVTRGTALGAINLPSNFEVNFDIQPSATNVAGWANLMHFTGTGANCCQYGTRVPGLWFYSNSRRFHIIDGHYANGDLGNGATGNDECPITTQLTPNTPTTVRIVSDSNMSTIYYNGRQMCQETRVNRRPWPTTQVWLSDPWYPAVNAQIRNFSVTVNAGPPPPPPMTMGEITTALSSLTVAESLTFQQQSRLTAQATATVAQVAAMSRATSTMQVQTASILVQYASDQAAVSRLIATTTGATLQQMTNTVNTLSNQVAQEQSALLAITNTAVGSQIAQAASVQTSVLAAFSTNFANTVGRTTTSLSNTVANFATTATMANGLSTNVASMSQVLMQQSNAVGVALSSTAASVSQQVQQAQQAILQSIASAVQAVPTATQGTPTFASPQITVTSNALRLKGNGAAVVMETQCGSIDPCNIVQAINMLGNL